MMHSLLYSFKNKQFTIVSIVYYVIAFTILFYYGINDDGEAFKYLLDGKSIAENKGLNYGEFSYFFITYSILLAFFIKLKISLWAVVIIQILLAYVAAYCLYKLILRKANNHFLALLIFTCYLFCYPIQKWLFFIYSEGVYTSFVVIGFCVFMKLVDDFSFKNVFFFILLTIAIITTRPVGILFLLAVFTTFLIYCYISKQHKLLRILILAGLIICIALLNSPVRYFINPDSLKRMEVICMVPQKNITASYSQYNRVGLMGAFNVVKNDIGVINFLKVGIKKLQLFFGLVRPYYSLKNNIFLAINWLFYPFAIIGIFFYKKKELLLIKVCCISMLFFTALSIFITCDDWSNRFIAPIFPFIIVLAGFGINFLRCKKLA
ncbi:hypothetical protein ACFOWM_04395 [Ferruginibacter yonginensis]|uniref:Glycosyltransferase RgtA/B/C/D-like domain-containing protein n=1 Tax=Ferruginibacter yonginensis TaxID=1310416 RepID=A0ABV8QP86_9BACT